MEDDSQQKSGNGEDSGHDFRLSQSEWDKHTRQTMSALAKLDMQQDMIKSIAENTQHLKKLDTLEIIANKLIDPATGRKQVPLSAHMVAMAFFGTAMIVILVANTQKTVRLNWTQGLVIENGPVLVIPDKPVEIK